ncbi:uncharacterized protein LOC132644168 [Lycium barbarum]|uniref:uncharacterized protein LOC132644168 n=1 Tax=Lycium barbarum TaxID=112863 RepID=UPI00293E6423|nr:uncharacterized protein LOC132644168 [Lycium barbarum]
MFFYLTTLSLQKFITEDVPVPPEETPDNDQFIVVEAWNHSDFLCKNYILNGLDDGLYNVYSAFNGAFQVAAFIEKLPPLWKDFKNYLKHKRKEMTLEDLIVRLRIEEDNKSAEKKANGKHAIMGENIVETAPTSSKNRKRASKGKNVPSKKKFKASYYNCGKFGHMASDCRAPKNNNNKKKGQANLAEMNNEVDNLCAILSEYNLVGNPREWWIDSGATRHECSNKEFFSSYDAASPNKTIFMANSATAKIERTSNIALKMTYGKIVMLKNVLHVPEMRKNLVSTSLLVKNGFK